MDDLNEELVGGEEASRQGDEAEDDDVDIYQDLPEEGETMIKESDANFNVIERFNKLLEPKKRKDDDFYEENLSEEDVDLYDDLNTFEKQLAAEELQAKVEILEQKCSTLDSMNAELKAELDKVNKKNLALTRNISSIFKTAKAELERKDRQLKDLQREHDTLIFRRGAANNRMPPHNSNTPPINTNPLPANSSILPTKTSMLNPEYMVNPSQNPAAIPSFHEFKRDTVLGNLVTIENETECTFKMGPITLSFISESSDFRKRRLERLGNVARGKGIARPDPKSSKERVNGEPSSEQQPESSQVLPELLVERANLLKQLSNANENLEEGEFTEEPTAEIERQPQQESRDMSRRKNVTHSRGRSRSRSRSPIDGQRKRSVSDERLDSRNSRSHDRGPPKRSQRSPAKSSRYRNSGNSHFKSRSNRR